jgi:uncharacterized lipoprotein YddW (UPF0748 family)
VLREGSPMRLFAALFTTSLISGTASCASAAPLPGEGAPMRGIWEHTCLGPYPGNWGRALDSLVAGGFDAVFPMALRGCQARWPGSAFSAGVPDSLGDQLEACITEAHARGMEVHAWVVLWRVDQCDADFRGSTGLDERLQVRYDGTVSEWLCPSWPENLALQSEAVAELAERYDLDGINLDYVRFDGQDYCYCCECRRRFSARIRLRSMDWPADVLWGGRFEDEFLDWRNDLMLEAVGEIVSAARRARPGILVSVDVLPDAAVALTHGQDWNRWADASLVDFVCPMDYTTDTEQFRAWVADQVGAAGGRVPVVPGLGVLAADHALDPDVVSDQASAALEEGAAGWVVFTLRREYLETYPRMETR